MKITLWKGPARPKLMFVALACSLSSVVHAADNDIAKQQKQIRSMVQDTLQRLYKAEPRTKEAIKHAYGYAVFSDLGVKILFGGTGNGKGLAVNNRSKHETFMKMIEVQAGLNGCR